MKKYIIAANLGQVRILKYSRAGDDPIEKDHLLEEPAESTKQHVHTIQETVTDQSGRFGRGDSVGFETGMSYGEEHHLQEEIKRSMVKKIATRIESVLAAEAYPVWILAAPTWLLARIKEMLPANACKSLVSTVGADLTRWPLAKLEARFCTRS